MAGMAKKRANSSTFGPSELAKLLLGTSSSAVPTPAKAAGGVAELRCSEELCQPVRPLKRLRVQLKQTEPPTAARGIATAGQGVAEQHQEPVDRSTAAGDATSDYEGKHIRTHTAPTAAAQHCQATAAEQAVAVFTHPRAQQPGQAALPAAVFVGGAQQVSPAAAGRQGAAAVVPTAAVGCKAENASPAAADARVPPTTTVPQHGGAAAGSGADRGRKLVLVPNQLTIPTHVKPVEGTAAGALLRQQQAQHGAGTAQTVGHGSGLQQPWGAPAQAQAFLQEGGTAAAAATMQHLLPQLSEEAEAAAEEALAAAAATAAAQDKTADTADNAAQQDPTQHTQHVLSTAADVCQLVQLFCPDVTAVLGLSPDTAGLTHNPAVTVDHPPEWQQDAGLVNPLQLLCLSGLRAACAQAGPRAASRKLLAAADAAPPRPCRAEGGTGLLPWFWSAQQLLLQELGADVLAGKAAAKSTAGDKLIAAVRGRVRLARLVATAHRLLQHQVGIPHKELEPPVQAGAGAVRGSAAADEHRNRERYFQQQQQQQQQEQEWVDSDEEDAPSIPTISLAPLPPGPLAAAEATLQAVAAVVEEAAAAAAAAGWAPVLVDQSGLQQQGRPGPQQHGQPGKELVADAALALGLVQLLCPATPAVLALRKDNAGPLCNPPVEADNPPRYQAQKGMSLEGPQLLTRSGLKVACMGILPNQLRVKLQQMAAAVATAPGEHVATATATATAGAATAAGGAVAPSTAAAPAAVEGQGAGAAGDPASAAAADGDGDGAEANESVDAPTTGLLPWFWSVHALAVSELHSPVWRAPNDDLPTGQRLVKVVRARVQLVQLLATACNLLRRGGTLPVPQAATYQHAAGAGAAAAAGAAGTSLPQGLYKPQAAFPMRHWQQQPQHQRQHLTPEACAAAEAALASVAALLDHRAAAVQAAGWPAPSAAPGLFMAFQSDVFVADAAFAYGFVQLLCPAVCDVAALRWDVCDVAALRWDVGQGQGPLLLHNLAVELDQPPRWAGKVETPEGASAGGQADSTVSADAAAAPVQQQQQQQQQQKQQQQRQQQQLQPAQLLTRSGLLAACAVLQPAALRDRLSELAVRAAPSYDGVDWGTGLLPWFWSAQQLLLTELHSYVWQRQGDSTSPGQCFQQAVQARVLLAELVVEVYRLCRRGRLTAKQQKVAQERLQQQQQREQQQREQEGGVGGGAHKWAGAGTGMEHSGLPVAASPESVAAALSGLRALIALYESGYESGLQAGHGEGQGDGDTGRTAATATAAAAEAGGDLDGSISKGGAAVATKAAGTSGCLLGRDIRQLLQHLLQQQQQQRDIWQDGVYRPLSPEAAAAADAALASAVSAAATAAAAAKTHKPAAVAKPAADASSSGSSAEEAVQAVHNGSTFASTEDAVQAVQAVHTGSSSSIELVDAATALQLVLMFYPQLLSAPALQPDTEQQLTNLAVVRDEPAKYVWGWGEWCEELSQQQLCTVSGLKLACFGIQAEPLKHRLHELIAAAATPAAGGGSGSGRVRTESTDGGGDGGDSSGGRQGLLPWFLFARDLLLQDLQKGLCLDAKQQMSAEQQLQQHIMARVQLTHVVFSAYSVLKQVSLGQRGS